jgi:hypothetical protein
MLVSKTQLKILIDCLVILRPLRLSKAEGGLHRGGKVFPPGSLDDV